MARKQFVSSKKNAPSRAVSSKEAALHGRNAATNGKYHRDSVEGEASSGLGSPASSNGSSLFSSDEHDGEEGEDENDSTPAVAVEVLPATAGRGKQLRFPTGISRGKESRVLHEGGGGDGSDSESLLSIESDDEEGVSEDEGEEEDKSSTEELSQQSIDASSRPHSNSHEKQSSNSSNTERDESLYPIKASRARKRHRPDSGYYKRMSTYVRDCLLSVRDGADSAEVFREASRAAFRRKLQSGDVERVTWKEATPSESGGKNLSDSEPRKYDPPARIEKKEKHKKEHRTKEKRSSSGSSRRKLSSSSSSSSKLKDRGPNGEKSTKESSNSKTTTTPTKTTSPLSEKDSTIQKSKTGMKEEKNSKSSSDSNGSASKESEKSTVCESCKKKLHGETSQKEKAAKKQVETKSSSTQTIEVEAAKVAPSLPGTFLIPSSGERDVTKLQAAVGKLHEQARALKHEGDRKGGSESGSAGQIAQGKLYLQSSAKFFQCALKLQDMKEACKERGDAQHARKHGENSVITLSQTLQLIESTIRKFQTAGSTRMMAVGYKMASIVLLTIYRLQHLKLFSLYSDLFTPGRSPESRQNGTTPPISSSGDNRESAVRAHLLKEMEHTLRGFEMWRRYEACKVEVLPRITNPAITDLSMLFEDLDVELNRA